MGYDYRLEASHFPKELALLLYCMAKEPHDLATDAPPERFADTDWDRFLRLALHHRLYPELYAKLLRAGTDWIPALVLRALRGHYESNTWHMLRLTAEMERVGSRLADSGIRSIVLKGPVLAAELYGGLSLRTSGDLDILIPLRELDRAEKLLLQLGYVKDDYIHTVLNDWKWRHHHLAFFHADNGTKLELHWRLGPGPGKEPGFQELWERKRTMAATAPIHYLGREDLFLFLVSHGARHGWSRLRWLQDIDRIARQPVEGARLFHLLKKHRLSHIGGQALALTQTLLATPLSPGLARLAQTRRAAGLAQEALFYIRREINLHHEPLPEEVAAYHKRHLFSLKAFPNKLLFLLSFMYPYPEDVEMLALPKRLHFLYFPLRPFLWAWRKTRKHAFT